MERKEHHRQAPSSRRAVQGAQLSRALIRAPLRVGENEPFCGALHEKIEARKGSERASVLPIYSLIYEKEGRWFFRHDDYLVVWSATTGHLHTIKGHQTVSILLSVQRMT